MTTIVFVIVTLAIMIAIVILYFKPYDYGTGDDRYESITVSSNNSADTSEETLWRSVKIRPGLIACERAMAIRERVFLSREAPRLPLANCGEGDCRCHYIFHEDRRSGFDRRAEFDRLGHLLSGKREDRRRSTGRRVDDLVPA